MVPMVLGRTSPVFHRSPLPIRPWGCDLLIEDHIFHAQLAPILHKIIRNILPQPHIAVGHDVNGIAVWVIRTTRPCSDTVDCASEAKDLANMLCTSGRIGSEARWYAILASLGRPQIARSPWCVSARNPRRSTPPAASRPSTGSQRPTPGKPPRPQISWMPTAPALISLHHHLQQEHNQKLP